MTHNCDMHIHTLVSDGANHPREILESAAKAGLTTISFTDHDALGAYKNFQENIFETARSMNMELIPGIELDTKFQNQEIHLLGYGMDIRHPGLCQHLMQTQEERRKKTCQQISALNRYYNTRVINPDDVFIDGRDTFMKPHLINKLLEGKKFENYRQAAKFLNQSITVSTQVKKPDIRDAIQLLTDAGARPVLAHPLIYEEKGISLEELIRELVPLGLWGLETDYPYDFKPDSDEYPDHKSREKILRVRHLARNFNLETTRGSDAHDCRRLRLFASNWL